MNTETLKISLAQKILAITDYTLLNKLKILIEKENIVGYDQKGNAVSEKDYIYNLDQILNEIDNDSALLYTTNEVKQTILNENNLAQYSKK